MPFFFITSSSGYVGLWKNYPNLGFVAAGYFRRLSYLGLLQAQKGRFADLSEAPVSHQQPSGVPSHATACKIALFEVP
jgi:hypothetical protein